MLVPPSSGKNSTVIGLGPFLEASHGGHGTGRTATRNDNIRGVNFRHVFYKGEVDVLNGVGRPRIAEGHRPAFAKRYSSRIGVNIQRPTTDVRRGRARLDVIPSLFICIQNILTTQVERFRA